MKDEVVSVSVAQVCVDADPSPSHVPRVPGIDLDLGRDDEVAGERLVSNHSLLGIGGGGAGWLRTPLLIDHVPPTKDQAELGVFELNVSWKRTGEELVLFTVTVTVLMAGIPRASVTVNWAV